MNYSESNTYPRIVWEGVYDHGCKDGPVVPARIVQTAESYFVAEQAIYQDSMGNWCWTAVPEVDRRARIFECAFATITSQGFSTEDDKSRLKSIYGRLEYLCGIGSVNAPDWTPQLHSISSLIANLEEQHKKRQFEERGDVSAMSEHPYV